MRLDQLKMDWKIVTVIVVSTLTVSLDHYHRFFTYDSLSRAFSLLGLPITLLDQYRLVIPYKALDRMVLYWVIPMLIIVLLFRQSPARYGFQVGDWKAGLALTAAGCGGMALVMLIVARTGDFQGYYGTRPTELIPLVIDNGLDLFGWEFIFRGFLLFALYPVCGPYAIILQAVPFAIAHIGKPELETLSCIFGGSGFGYVAWRTRSFLYPFLIHWFLVTITVLIAGGAIG